MPRYYIAKEIGQLNGWVEAENETAAREIVEEKLQEHFGTSGSYFDDEIYRGADGSLHMTFEADALSDNDFEEELEDDS